MKPFLAGLPNAHGVLPQWKNFFLLSSTLKDGDIPSRGPGNTRRLDSARQCRLSGWRARELGPVWLVSLVLLSPHLGVGELTLESRFTALRLRLSFQLPVSGPVWEIVDCSRESSEARGSSVATRAEVGPWDNANGWKKKKKKSNPERQPCTNSARFTSCIRGILYD